MVVTPMLNPQTIKSKLKTKIDRLIISSFINLIITPSFFEASPEAISFNDGSSLRDSNIGRPWGRIFILEFAYILRKLPSGPRLSFPENTGISAAPPC